jgi:hypothetical protein
MRKLKMTREPIVSQDVYPAEILEKLEHSRNITVSIANRWMMGWPERVKTLLVSGEYWPALENQQEMELEAAVEATQTYDQQGNLAPWEINQMAGIDPAPPVPS